MITLTPSAAEHIRALTPAEEPEKGLRLYVDKGGCSGLQYEMNIDRRHEGDFLVELEGAKLFVDSASSGYLKGCTIDYLDSLTSTGFRIINPNAKQTCGCGTSFEA